MPTCSFCKKIFKEPRGLTLFTFDGRSIYFCSGKCRKNTQLKRDPRKVNWVRKDKERITALKKESVNLEEEKKE